MNSMAILSMLKGHFDLYLFYSTVVYYDVPLTSQQILSYCCDIYIDSEDQFMSNLGLVLSNLLNVQNDTSIYRVTESNLTTLLLFISRSH